MQSYISFDSAALKTFTDTFGSVRLFEVNRDQIWKTSVKISADSFLAQKTAAEVMQLIGAELNRIAADDNPNWVLSIPPAGSNGFAIDIRKDEFSHIIRVQFGELEEEFSSVAAATVWVGRALSKDYRLRIVTVDGAAKEWHLEPVDPDCESGKLAAGHVGFFQSKTRTATEIRQNSFAGQALPTH